MMSLTDNMAGDVKIRNGGVVILWCLFFFIFEAFIYTDVRSEVARFAGAPGQAADREAWEEGFVFMPSLSFLIDAGIYSGNDLSHTMLTNRTFSLDILRYNNIVLSMFVDEERTYRETEESNLDPWIIHYNMDYGNIRWEFKDGASISYFVDHQCNNIMNREDIGPRELRYYGMGFKWESPGMRPGHKNDGVVFNKASSFSFLSKLDYMFLISYCLANGYTERFRYDMLIRGGLRYDALRIYNLIPYIEGAATAIIDEDYGRARFDRSFETGIRAHLSSGDLTPFIGYIHKKDAEIYNGTTLRGWLMGLRFESMLYDYSTQEEKEIEPVAAAFIPEIHLLVQYSKFLFNDDLNFSHRLDVRADLVRIDDIFIFADNGLLHNSPGRGGLWPYYLDTRTGGGMGYLLNKHNLIFESFYEYVRFDDGNHSRGYRQRFQTAGLRIMSRNMKPGYINYGIDFSKDWGVEWLNRVGWILSASSVIRDLNYPYSSRFLARAQWDILRYGIIIPYLALQAAGFEGDGSLWEYSAESGARIYDRLPLLLFFQYYYRTEEDINNNLYRHQFMFGIRAEV